MSALIDLSHEIENGMVTYKGLPPPIICDYRSREQSRRNYEEGTEFHIGKIEMVANTGTYVDAPFHRYANGVDLSQPALASLANLDGLVIRANVSGNRAVGELEIRGLELTGKAVLIHTGWDKHWRTEKYFDGHPFLTKSAGQYLCDAGAAFVGIDSFNIDDTSDGSRPAHTILLGADIPIAEHLCNLQSLPDKGFRFFSVPVKIKGFGSFPVRAFAITD